MLNKLYLFFSFFLFFASSQIHPDNPLLLGSYACATSILIFVVVYIHRSLKVNLTSLAFLPLSVCVLIASFHSPESSLVQFARLLYPWILYSCFFFLHHPILKRLEFISLISTASLALYAVLSIDLLFIFHQLFSSGFLISLYALKGSTLIYNESNTFAFFVLYNYMFRDFYLKLPKAEHIAIFFVILSTISRSTILFYFLYLIIRSFLVFYQGDRLNSIRLLLSRFLPLVTLCSIFVMFFLISGVDTFERNLFSLSDISFISRVLLLDHVYNFINQFSLLDILFGIGPKAKFAIESDSFTQGHTLFGLIPEIGFFFFSFLFYFFFHKAFQGKVYESVILSLAILAYIPISYIAPVLILSSLPHCYHLSLSSRLRKFRPM